MTMASLTDAGILYYSELPRFEKDRRSLNYGITATFSVPLDRGLADQCKRAVNTNIKLQEQLLATKRLEHELLGLKNVGNWQGGRAIYWPNVGGVQ